MRLAASVLASWGAFAFVGAAGGAGVGTVRELTDLDFEHVTQASTGATTGDWFVAFENPDCEGCVALSPVWDDLGRRLRDDGRSVILALVKANAADSRLTTRRFGRWLGSYPALLLLSKGEVRPYGGAFSVDALYEWAASGGHAAVPSEPMPGPLGLGMRAMLHMESLLDALGVHYKSSALPKRIRPLLDKLGRGDIAAMQHDEVLRLEVLLCGCVALALLIAGAAAFWVSMLAASRLKKKE